MKELKKIIFIIIPLFLLQGFGFFMTPTVKADVIIPDNFNKNLDLDEVYIYNVTAFNTTKRLEWADVDWTAPVKGFANTTPGGQIKVNFTGFYEKDPNDFFNIFNSPMPYMDIEFIENRSGILTSNVTFYNVSNGEADLNLLFGYNQFKSGFLIPINNFAWLKEQAYAQDQPPFMNATVTIQENATRITFDFQQKVSFQQKSRSTYDKLSGLLVYTNSSCGNYTLEMTIINLPNFTITDKFVPSFQACIICSAIVITTIISIPILKKRNKIKLID
ncbi:MAG: hypothetical protein ACFFA0_04530 [Promethearchaeota archaeon]